jgi:hypothetical protein
MVQHVQADQEHRRRRPGAGSRLGVLPCGLDGSQHGIFEFRQLRV